MRFWKILLQKFVLSERKGKHFAKGTAVCFFAVPKYENRVVSAKLAQYLTAYSAGRAKIFNTAVFAAAHRYCRRSGTFGRDKSRGENRATHSRGGETRILADDTADGELQKPRSASQETEAHTCEQGGGRIPHTIQGLK